MIAVLKELWRPLVGTVCGLAMAVALFADVTAEKLLIMAGFVGGVAGLRTADKLMKGRPDV